MKTICLILAWLTLGADLKSPPSTWDKILSKHYYLTYSDDTRPFVNFDSLGKVVIQKGVILRDQRYMLSKSDSDMGILESPAFLYMDNSLRTIDIGPESILGAFLIQPLCDPYEIVNYAISHKMGFQKYVQNGTLTYDFFSFKQDEPIYNITISFYNDQKDDFSIKLVYQQYPLFKQDIIRYKFVKHPREETSAKIADFVDFKNGKYEPKEQYKEYLFRNEFLLRTK